MPRHITEKGKLTCELSKILLRVRVQGIFSWSIICKTISVWNVKALLYPCASWSGATGWSVTKHLFFLWTLIEAHILLEIKFRSLCRFLLQIICSFMYHQTAKEDNLIWYGLRYPFTVSHNLDRSRVSLLRHLRRSRGHVYVCKMWKPRTPYSSLLISTP